jgi:hypothetical protein
MDAEDEQGYIAAVICSPLDCRKASRGVIHFNVVLCRYRTSHRGALEKMLNNTCREIAGQRLPLFSR